MSLNEANITLFYGNSTAFFNSLCENGNFIHDEQPIGHRGTPKNSWRASRPVVPQQLLGLASLAVGGGRKSSAVLGAPEQPGQGGLAVPLSLSMATGGAGAKAEESGGVRPALWAAQG